MTASFRSRLLSAPALTGLLVLLIGVAPVRAEKIENKVAVFAALDKVTARISKLEVALGETVQFGALKVTPRVCYTRPPTEPPKTTAFVEVDEVQLTGAPSKLYRGWMFAQSPGLSGVEHPVFDVWLTSCAEPVVVARQRAAPSNQRKRRKRRRRRRR